MPRACSAPPAPNSSSLSLPGLLPSLFPRLPFNTKTAGITPTLRAPATTHALSLSPPPPPSLPFSHGRWSLQGTCTRSSLSKCSPNTRPPHFHRALLRETYRCPAPRVAILLELRPCPVQPSVPVPRRAPALQPSPSAPQGRKSPSGSYTWRPSPEPPALSSVCRS
nr:uncharacterized protein LOC129483068 [Symphalangus syndactylus]